MPVMPGTDFALRSQDYARQLAQKPAAPAASANPAAPAAATAKTDDGFSFYDLLDIVNPLQHIPVVSTIYKHLTGDKIGIPEKIAGDALYGGVVGFLCSIGDALFTEATGKSVGDTVYAAVFGDDNQPANTPAVAANDTPAPEPVPAPVPASGGSTLSISQVTAAYRASGRLLEAY
jgi:hypothetical protein